MNTDVVENAYPGLITPDDLEWIDMGTGHYIKFLRYSSKTGEYALLAKSPKGNVEPTHRHVGSVNLFVVSGTANWNGTTAPPGSWAHEPDGAVHQSVVHAEERVDLCLGRGGGLDILDADGSVIAEFRVDEFVKTLPASVRQRIDQD